MGGHVVLPLSSFNYLITTVPKFAIIFQKKGTKDKEDEIKEDQLTELTGPASPVEAPVAAPVWAPSPPDKAPPAAVEQPNTALAPVVEEAALSASIPLSSVTKVINAQYLTNSTLVSPVKMEYG